ncbi:beclin-2 [Phodopus roborovskii]|uniref:Gm38100 protein n=1 Tax=Phodopus roborovskii TaxID=109678 RepID=A0AAU9ZCT8_PHORO|nr:beclin-2 [Phodopus roborovskii]CAH6789558.1 Gm38100 [Phodopus roborovskii]
MASTLFLCQLCNKPLKLSQTLCALQEEHLEAQHCASPSTKMTVSEEELRARTYSTPLPGHGRTLQERACCTFTLLGGSVALRTLDSIQNTTLEISEIVSGQKVVEHPLCVDCVDNLLTQLDAQITLVESDTQKYRSFLERESLVSKKEREAMHLELCAELRSLEQEEARLAQELKDIDHHHARIAAELRAAQAESKELNQQNEQVLMEYSALKMEQLELTDQLSSVENRLEYAQRQLRRLRKTSIFNITFTILDEGPLGIINNFRLGCLPGIQVGWDEINAAWGQTALLLFTLAKTVGLQFQRYQLVPRGGHSYLRSLAGDGELLLFSDGSHSVFLNNKFDRGVKAFLDCLQQFVDEVEKKGCPFLPYRIHVNEGMMEDARGSGECYSIRTHLNTEEEWAKALKFMLTNLKLILAWASLRYRCRKEPN